MWNYGGGQRSIIERRADIESLYKWRDTYGFFYRLHPSVERGRSVDRQLLSACKLNGLTARFNVVWLR